MNAALDDIMPLDYLDGRITVHPDICNRHPTIRGRRITVETIICGSAFRPTASGNDSRVHNQGRGATSRISSARSRSTRTTPNQALRRADS